MLRSVISRTRVFTRPTFRYASTTTTTGSIPKKPPGIAKARVTNPQPNSMSPEGGVPAQKWYKSKWAVAAHIVVVYFGVTFYVKYLIDNKYKPSFEAKMQAAAASENAQIQPVDSLAKDASTVAQVQVPALQQDTTKDEPKQRTFDDMAEKYDKEIGMDEFVIGMNLMRRLLMRHATGNVLEVSAGTGRNIPYYPSTKYITSLTFMDASYPMLKQCVKKFDQYADRFLKHVPWYSSWFSSEGPLNEIPVDFIHSSCETLEFDDNHFDTVVDTFGLCSVGVHEGPHHTEHAVRMLRELGRVCKPDGKILLLEHGKASNFYEWLNGKLEEEADKHFEKWSCWWNRDILKMVEEAGLEIESSWRWHFGTTYYIIARPKKSSFTSDDIGQK